ncbi:MAG: hypothetical protein M3M97_03325 [Actinomycetota bacterium]|nr:hypothetical protein [Actinomycetota bacterium]
MSSSGLVQWGAIAAIAAGVVWIVVSFLSLVVGNPGLSPEVNALYVVAVLLVLGGLVGFHALQKRNYGTIGWVGFYMIIAAVFAQVLGWLGIFAGVSAVLVLFVLPASILVILVGFVLYGVATLQAKVLPRWCGIVLMIAVPVAVVLGWIGDFPSIGYVWLGLVWLTLGYLLWSQRGTAAGQRSRVR